MDHYKITTDETLRETIRHGNSSYPFAYYPENLWQFDFHRIDWHWHRELEFLIVADGAALCLAGTDRIELQEGCGILINSGILHRFEAQCDIFTPNIVFSPTLLAPEKSLIYEKYIRPVIKSSVPYQIFDPHTSWRIMSCNYCHKFLPFRNRSKIMNYVRFSFSFKCGISC